VDVFLGLKPQAVLKSLRDKAQARHAPRLAPGLRAAMLAVDAELTAGGIGGPLMIESLAHVLAIHLIRHLLGPRRLRRG
jgi:hypothetical protein